MQQTLTVAVLINFGIGMGAIWLGVKDRFSRLSLPKMVFNHPPLTGSVFPAPIILLAMALSGLAAMIYEVAWTRELVLIFGSSTYAFTLMLVAFLTGIALGSLAIIRWADRIRHPFQVLAGIEFAIAFFALFGQYWIGRLPEVYLYLFWLVGPSLPILWVGQLTLSLGLMLVPALLLGMTFPLAVRTFNGSQIDPGRSFGYVYGVNTLGTVLGALAAALFLIPWFGLQETVMIGAAINLLSSLLLVSSDSFLIITRRFTYAGVSMGIMALVIILIPSWDPVWMSSGVYKEAPSYLNLVNSPVQVRKVVSRYRLLFYEEGSQATVTVIERPSFGTQPHLTLSIDGKVDASTGADMSTQVLSGHLPLLIAERIERVLVIGYASGVTAGSALLYPVKQLVAAEIEPAVIEASRYFDDFNHRPLEDPRLGLALDDGRHYLQIADRQFDVIISEPSNPWMSGPSRLFTREFFELTRRHLSQDGVMAQWIQIYGMSPDLLKTALRTFQDVFPHVLVFQTSPADLLLLGSKGPIRLDLPHIKEVFSMPDIASDLKRIGIDSAWDLLARLRIGEEGLLAFTGDGPLNTDDNGLLEFSAPRLLYAETIEHNQQMILKTMEKEKEPLGLLAYLTSPEPGGKDMAQAAVALGRSFLKEGAPDVAERFARIALVFDGTSDSYWLLGEIHEYRKNHLTALQYWKKALRVDPGHPWALRSMALYHQKRGEFKEAEGLFRRMEQISVEEGSLPLYHGINLYYLGRPAQAITHLEEFDRASNEEDLSIIARYYLKKAYEVTGQRERGAFHAARMVEALRQMRDRLEQDQGQKELDNLLQLIQIHSEHPVFHKEELALKGFITRYLVDPLGHYYKGVSLYFLGYDQPALKELQQVLKILPDGDDSKRTRYYIDLIVSGRPTGDKGSLLLTGL